MSQPARFFDCEVRPPRGSWRAVIEGRQFPPDGAAAYSESEAFEALKRWRMNNGTFSSDDATLAELWAYWRAQEPARALAGGGPSLGQMARNLATTAAKTIGAVLKGKPALTGRALSDHRIHICKACPRMEPRRYICLECNCYLPVKTALTHAECPLGKW